MDNFSSHIAECTRTRAAELGIRLVFLPIASPHLQPIDPIWGNLKQLISPISNESAEVVRALVEKTFRTLTRRLSFAADWIDRFLDVNSLR